MTVLRICLAAVAVLAGALLASPASATVSLPAATGAQSVQPSGSSLLVPVHRRSYRHCHPARRVCRVQRVRRCVQWRRGYCQRWVVRPVRRCWVRRGYCHRW